MFGFSALNNSPNRRHGVDNLVVQSSSTPAVTNLVHTTQFRHQTRPAPPKTGLSPLGTSVAPAITPDLSRGERALDERLR